jgi:uncharacterized protein
LNSALYFGRVRHRRHQPVAHAFDYRLFMAYLDLDELPEVLDGRWFWSARRPALARFREKDYLGRGKKPIAEAFRDLVEDETGHRPEGAVRMLTNLRYLGYVFNPVTFYYGFDKSGALESVAAEITNTPWMERRTYVHRIADGERRGAATEFVFDKDFHISPFMPMDIEYRWRFTPPGEGLAIVMENRREGERIFEATLDLERQALDGRGLSRALLRYPALTAKVTAAIYFQAARLKLKGCPVHDHPAPGGTATARRMVR